MAYHHIYLIACHSIVKIDGRSNTRHHDLVRNYIYATIWFKVSTKTTGINAADCLSIPTLD
jgi:hypothetical protein